MTMLIMVSHQINQQRRPVTQGMKPYSLLKDLRGILSVIFIKENCNNKNVPKDF